MCVSNSSISGQYIYYYINFQIVAIIFRVSLLKYIDMFLMIANCRIIPKF